MSSSKMKIMLITTVLLQACLLQVALCLLQVLQNQKKEHLNFPKHQIISKSV